MDSGRVTVNSPFPQSSAVFLLQHLIPQPLPINLFPLGLNLWLLEDGRGGLYPLSYDCAGSMRHLPFLVSVCSLGLTQAHISCILSSISRQPK